MKHTHLLHSQMIEAIAQQDLVKVRQLIAGGVNVNYINDSCASSAIEAAAKVGNIEIVDFLLKSKADPNKWYMRSPLVIAIDSEFVDIAHLLIDAGANINTDPEHDNTPLELAVCLKDLNFVKKLVNTGANVNAYGRESNSPLSVALADANKEIYEYLLPFVEIHNLLLFIEEGLVNAILDDSLSGIEFAASIGANLNSIESGRETPLTFALSNGHLSAAKKLIELGVDKTLKDYKGKTALDYAIDRKYKEIIQLLSDLD